MGMFDYVKYEADCAVCGEPLSGFQTKDGRRELETVEPSTVDLFYTTCDSCNSWHDFHVERECVVKDIKVIVENFKGE